VGGERSPWVEISPIRNIPSYAKTKYFRDAASQIVYNLDARNGTSEKSYIYRFLNFYSNLVNGKCMPNSFTHIFSCVAIFSESLYLPNSCKK
jgi:hypothetical protein